MGITRTDLFNIEQNELAQIARVLSHPARIAIIQHMVEKKSCINNDLVNELGLSQPTISQHLRELKMAGIIKGNIEGNSVQYCVDTKRWFQIQDSFNELFNSVPKEPFC